MAEPCSAYDRSDRTYKNGFWRITSTCTGLSLNPPNHTPQCMNEEECGRVYSRWNGAPLFADLASKGEGNV